MPRSGHANHKEDAMSAVTSMRVTIYTHRKLTRRERELVDRECQRSAALLVRQWDREDAEIEAPR